LGYIGVANCMINPKILRETPDIIESSLTNRGISIDLLKKYQHLDRIWREKQQSLESLQALRNKSVPKGKPTEEERETLSRLSKELKDAQSEVNALKDELSTFSLEIPNILQADVPIGQSEDDNHVIRTEGKPKEFKFKAKSHDELASDLNLIDFDRATKISGSRFAVFTGLGAKLERAISSFMIDTHVNEFGYKELSPPVIINTQSLKGTGQLPKFEDDQYKLSDDFWLSPTAEVQLTNFHHNEILSSDQLPIKYCAFTQCFRKEAGNYGKDMKGLIRLHQFNKVELVQFVPAESSNTNLDQLLSHAEFILKKLNLPYRVVKLCSADTGFSASKTYDLEVWFPSQNKYREISSCSNFLDFQARRSKIRYRDQNNDIQYVHTLNGSGLAVGRTFAAILENYQDEFGIIHIPDVLKGYMGLEEIKHG
jgi:seryl-tRNA synthetase